MKRFLAILTLLSLSAAAFGSKGNVIKYGPWVSAAGEDEFSVVFKTAGECMVWVEIAPDDGSAFEATAREAFYETRYGRRFCGAMHRVKVTGLKAGTAYRYRIYGQEVIDASQDNHVVYSEARVLGNGKGQRNFKARTFDTAAGTCRFTMVNDIHANADRYRNLLEGVNPDDYAFLLLNGDIVNGSSSIDTSLKYTFDVVSDKTANMPVVFVRGNHEGRGMDWHLLPQAVPTPTGEFYYSFREGPAAFIVLDGGEDKPDSDVEYAGHARYDEYRQAELEWLKKEVRKPEFTSAAYKICLIHIPTINDKGSWYTQRWLHDNFLPVLNKAGVQLMLSGHHHKFFVREAGECGNKFPIVSNSSVERLDVQVTKGRGFDLKFFDTGGKQVRSLHY